LKINDIVRLHPTIITEARRFQEPEFENEKDQVKGSVKLGPYTVNFIADVWTKVQLGAELYPATYNDPAEYDDNETVGFLEGYDECEIKFVSITGPDGQPVQGADFAYTFYHHNEDGTVDVETTKENFFNELSPKTDFDKFVLQNQDAVFAAFVKALNAATGAYAKHFGIERTDNSPDERDDFEDRRY
jgi:hypothetical protein